MTKKDLLNLSDSKLNRVAIIEGTNHDRRRKITTKTEYLMKKMYRRGKSIRYIAQHFGFSESAVKYRLSDDETKKKINSKRNLYVNNYTPEKYYRTELAKYKRWLIEKNKKLKVLY